MADAKILIVEDDEAVASLIERYLERLGYVALGRVARGEDALREAERLQPDLALMDITLAGDLDGVQTATRLREHLDLPVVFVTGVVDEETIQRSQEAKAFGYIVKPFRPDDLKTSIDLALSKHQVEGRLRQIERWFTAAIKSTNEGVITTDEQLGVTFLNPVAEALTGWKLAEAKGRPLKEVFSVSPSESRLTSRTREENGSSGAIEEVSLQTRQGGKFPIECSVAPIRNDAAAAIGRVLVFRDITERRRAEEALSRSREQLRSLAAHLEKIREEERTRIAREVHDELGQMITGLRMDLAWIEKRFPAINDEPLRQGLAGKAQSMFGLLDHLVKAVRKIASELRPVALDDLGLLPAMEWQAREWQARTNIECQVHWRAGAVNLSAEQGTALFRIFQETLTNVARHAQATQVRAEMALEEGCLVLEIRDNGRGITEEEQRETKSFGLLGMKERARLLGGACTIQGAAGKGTVVSVKLPVTKENSCEG